MHLLDHAHWLLSPFGSETLDAPIDLRIRRSKSYVKHCPRPCGRWTSIHNNYPTLVCCERIAANQQWAPNTYPKVQKQTNKQTSHRIMEIKVVQTDLKSRSRAARSVDVQQVRVQQVSMRQTQAYATATSSPHHYDSFSRHEQTRAARINGTALGLHLQDYASTLHLPFG